MTADTSDVDKRMTAPQQPYTSREVGIGFLILVIGLVLTFVIPILAA